MIKKYLLFIGNILFLIIAPIWTLIASFLTFLTILISFKTINIFPLIKIWARSILFLLDKLTNLKVKYIGSVNKNKLLAPQHQSLLEIIALVAYLNSPVFILKRNLMRVPFFGYCLKYCKMIPVDKENRNKNWLKDAVSLFKEGKTIVLFPEGGRINFSKEVEYKKGIFKLAKTLKEKITPVAIDAGLFWPKYSFIKKPGTTKIIFGNEIEPDPILLRKNYHDLLKKNK